MHPVVVRRIARPWRPHGSDQLHPQSQVGLEQVKGRVKLVQKLQVPDNRRYVAQLAHQLAHKRFAATTPTVPPLFAAFDWEPLAQEQDTAWQTVLRQHHVTPYSREAHAAVNRKAMAHMIDSVLRRAALLTERLGQQRWNTADTIEARARARTSRKTRAAATNRRVLTRGPGRRGTTAAARRDVSAPLAVPGVARGRPVDREHMVAKYLLL